LSRLESEIANTEARLAELSRLLSDDTLYRNGEKAAQAVKEYETLTARLEELYQDWEVTIPPLHPSSPSEHGGVQGVALMFPTLKTFWWEFAPAVDEP